MKTIVSFISILLICICLIDAFHYFSFVSLCEEGRLLIEENLSNEIDPTSYGLSDRLTYICISGCGIENGSGKVVYRLESKTPFVLTGEKGSIEFEWYR